MDWRISSRKRFRFRGRILAPHIPIGSVSGSPVAGVLGNKLVTLGIRCCLCLFTLSTHSFGVELSYIISYLPSLRPVPISISLAVSNTTWIHLLWLQKSATKKLYSSCPTALLVWVSRLRCNSYRVGRLSGIASLSNWYSPVSHGPLGVSFCLRCDSYGGGRLSGIASLSNWYSPCPTALLVRISVRGAIVTAAVGYRA
jgi:hypothetical protein